MKETITAVSAILGLLTLIVGFVVLIVKWSRHTAKTESALEQALGELAKHLNDKSIHANEELEKLRYNTIKEGMEDLKSGLSKMGDKIEELGKR